MTLEIFFVIYESKDSKVWSAIESIAIQHCLRFHHKPQQLNPLQSNIVYECSTSNNNCKCDSNVQKHEDYRFQYNIRLE